LRASSSAVSLWLENLPRFNIYSMVSIQGSSVDRRLVCYYSGEATDDKGRYLAEMLEWTDEQLELVHDFIQWMFPLRERGFNMSVPLLDRASISEFRSRPELQHNLRISLLRMLKFYGLEMHQGQDVTIGASPNFKDRAQNWLSPGNHNHLRITRIIKSLRVLGLEQEAEAFFKCLAKIYDEEKEKSRSAISVRRHFGFGNQQLSIRTVSSGFVFRLIGCRKGAKFARS